jgi:hypothetical protein
MTPVHILVSFLLVSIFSLVNAVPEIRLGNLQQAGSTPQRSLSSPSYSQQKGAHGGAQQDLGREKKVPVILGVMSQCPDALYCEAVFDKVLHQVGEIIDLSLTFIGRYFTTSSH